MGTITFEVKYRGETIETFQAELTFMQFNRLMDQLDNNISCQTISDLKHDKVTIKLN